MLNAYIMQDAPAYGWEEESKPEHKWATMVTNVQVGDITG
jgi:hypothetical protein